MSFFGLSFVDDAIRNRERFFDRLGEEHAQREMLTRLVKSYLLCTALYGFIMGSFNGLFHLAGWEFAVATMIKVPLLFLLTTLIVLPAIYVTNTILGMKLGFTQTALLFLSAITISAFMLAACAPILVFFMLSTDSYPFIKLLNVSIFAISGLMGIGFFLRAVDHLRLFEGTPRSVLKVWLIVWSLIGAQMAWILRPFIGVADQPFQLFREQESNFYLNMIHTLRELIGTM
jgi:hypothetical protein